jgi:hypothetical protein
MVRRTRPGQQAMAVAVRVVGEPSRVAPECQARAYAVVVPVVRRPLPARGADRRPGDTPAAAEPRREGVA